MFGELKRAMRRTKLDRNDLRQATVQTLENFAIEAKAAIGADQFRRMGSAGSLPRYRALSRYRWGFGPESGKKTKAHKCADDQKVQPALPWAS